jgi:hypothetical protein
VGVATRDGGSVLGFAGVDAPLSLSVSSASSARCWRIHLSRRLVGRGRALKAEGGGRTWKGSSSAVV